VTVQPVDTLVWFEIGCLQNTPDRRAARTGRLGLTGNQAQGGTAAIDRELLPCLPLPLVEVACEPFPVSAFKVKANWSKVQTESRLSWSAVLLLARVMMSRRSQGGKAPRSAGAWGILQASEALGGEAFAPLADGVAVAIELGSDVLVGRVVCGRGAQDDAAAKDECLRCGAGAHQGFELGLRFRGQFECGTKGTWHGHPPGEQNIAISRRIIMATDAALG
jgi:hypothetical protein